MNGNGGVQDAGLQAALAKNPAFEGLTSRASERFLDSERARRNAMTRLTSGCKALAGTQDSVVWYDSTLQSWPLASRLSRPAPSREPRKSICSFQSYVLEFRTSASVARSRQPSFSQRTIYNNINDNHAFTAVPMMTLHSKY